MFLDMITSIIIISTNKKVKQKNIKNRIYYFCNDMINLKNFKSSLLKKGKKHYKGINIYYIGYITIKKLDDCGSIYSVNLLYLQVIGLSC